MSQLLAQYRDQIRRKGMPVAIRRFTGPAGPNRPFTDAGTLGFPKNYDASHLIGAIAQGDQTVIVLVDDLAAILPVLTTDRMVIEGKESTIKNVKKRRDGATLIALEIQCTG